jgi:hypothetical protein
MSWGIVAVIVIVLLVMLLIARWMLQRASEAMVDRMTGQILDNVVEQQEVNRNSKSEADLRAIDAHLRSQFADDPDALDAHIGWLHLVTEVNQGIDRIFGLQFMHRRADEQHLASLPRQVERLSIYLSENGSRLRAPLLRPSQDLIAHASKFATLATTAQQHIAKHREVGDETFMDLIVAKDHADRAYSQARSTARRLSGHRLPVS